VLRYDPVTCGLVAPLAAVGLLASDRRNRRDALLLVLLIGACCFQLGRAAGAGKARAEAELARRPAR
jgi:hypothetical protein